MPLDMRSGEADSENTHTGLFICTVCDYVYDPAAGDRVGGILPGTRFEDLAEDWVCPICGADKSKFVLCK